MRDRQFWRLPAETVVQQDIDVNEPRPPAIGRQPAQRLFDRLHGRQQLRWVQVCLDFDDPVQEFGLILHSKRRGDPE